MKRFVHLMAVGASLLSALATPPVADAATALVRWLPRTSAAITGYRVYTRGGGTSYGSSAPIWSGNPTPATDGTMAATVTYTPSASGANFFSVVAVGGTVESNLSQELPVGRPNPCRLDLCTSKTTCTFANVPDGASCDDDSFCNGPEMCVGGACDASQSRSCADAIACTTDSCNEAADKCTHVGPPGCCVACDSGDPCLADACAQGDCAAPGGQVLEIGRIKLMHRANDMVKLIAKGRFELDPSVDPSETGALIDMRTADGTLVYSSSIAGPLINVGASKGRYRYTASRVASDQQSNGVTRLDFRVKGSRWLVTIMADTPSLADAAAQSTLTMSFRLGGSCFRRMDMPCDQKQGLAICR